MWYEINGQSATGESLTVRVNVKLCSAIERDTMPDLQQDMFDRQAVHIAGSEMLSECRMTYSDESGK